MTITQVRIEDVCITCGRSEFNCPELLMIDRDLGAAIVIDEIDYYDQGKTLGSRAGLPCGSHEV